VDDGLWIFGYGSLLWRPAFPYGERRVGFVEGFARRFWQGSTDHRGVPGAPGRVVTLIPKAGERCWGAAFRVADPDRERVLEQLDHRERGGFERLEVDVHTSGDSRRGLRALVYVAGPTNPNYLGPAPLEAIAAQVRDAHGPSGSNADYVEGLLRALHELGVDDPHVAALAALLEQ
jgi:cation transport regulator ChaC